MKDKGRENQKKEETDRKKKRTENRNKGIKGLTLLEAQVGDFVDG